MSFLPSMYDNLSVGRALHAPDRPCSAMDRTLLPSSLGGEGSSAGAWHGPLTAAGVPGGPALRRCRQAFGKVSARAAGSLVCTYPRLGTRRLSDGPVTGISRERRSANARSATARLRAKGFGT